MTWKELWRWLWEQERRFFVPEADRPEIARLEAHQLTIRQGLANFHLLHAFPIEAAIEEWLATDQWPDREWSVEERYLLWLRFDVAGCWALTMGSGQRHVEPPITLLPGQEKEVARWLLLVWWESHGIGQAAAGLALEKWNRPFDEEDEEWEDQP